MGFDDVISPNNQIAELKASDRWQAIDELLENLVSIGKIKSQDRPAIEQAVKQRETAMSTAINKIGLPHASTNLVSNLVAALGRSKAGVAFGAPEEKPVHLVVLFLIPAGQTQQHVHALANIAKAFAKDSLLCR